MAVIDGVPGLEATIEVDGVALKEYNPPFHDDSLASTSHNDYHKFKETCRRASRAARAKGDRYRPHVVKYIEAKPGERFNFRFKRHPQFIRTREASGIFVQVSVDGFQSMACRNDDGIPRPVTWDIRMPYLVSGQVGNNEGAETHYMRFKNIHTDEAGDTSREEIDSQRERVRDLGVLRLKCYFLKHLDVPHPGVQVRGPDDTEVDTVSEEALKGKAIDCAVGFDTEPGTDGVPFTRVMDLDDDRRPFAVFEFRYRSREGLIQEGILPRRPITPPAREESPVLLEGSPAPADIVRAMSEEEVRRLAQQLLEERRNGGRGSRAPSAATPVSAVTPVSQRRRARQESSESRSRHSDALDSAERYKTRRLSNGRLEIDLTEDK